MGQSWTGAELSKGLPSMKPCFECPQIQITERRHLQPLQSQSWASLVLSIPQLLGSFGPAPTGTDTVMGGRRQQRFGGGAGHDDKRLLLLATLTSLHSDATGKGSKSQQIVLGSEGNSKSHVSLSLAKSCKADSSCPPLAFSPPLRVLLMKSLTPIWEIAVAKHALPCYQKSF